MNDAVESPVILNESAERAKQDFVKTFGRVPTCMAAAPGRVNLIGDHVDYNDGLVLPFAIDRYTIIAGDVANDSSSISTIHSVGLNESIAIDLRKPIVPTTAHWSNYVKGVLHGFQQIHATLPALDLLIYSTVPTGSGLSSSAALEVSIATILEIATGTLLDKKQKALLCQKAEHDFAKVPCGVMDQFVSVFGQEGSLLLLDCQNLSTQLIGFDDTKLALLVINSNVQHELAGSEYALRRQRCESASRLLGLRSLRKLETNVLETMRDRLSEIEYRRAKHVVTENERTLRFTEQFSAGEFESAGELLYQSHASLRDDYQVSCPELDQLVELAQEIGLDGGVYGARMTGGGFGGSMIALVASEKANNVANQILKEFNQTRQANQARASAFITKPSRGAHEV